MKLTKALPAPVETVREEFDRLFDRLSNTGMFGQGQRVYESMWSPTADFSENEKEYIVRLEVPGIAKEDLEVNVEGQTVTVSGTREFDNEEKTEEYFWRERQAGKFVRALQLPGGIDRAKVTATYEHGIMTVRLPKAEPTARTRIPIK